MNELKILIHRILPYSARGIIHLYVYNKIHHTHRYTWKNLSTYDEKIHYLSSHLYGKKFAKYADKYEVRQYVSELGLEKYLIPLIGVWNSTKDIDFTKLPKEYILKANHGSGELFYEIVRDNKKVDHEAIRLKMNRAMQTDYGIISEEYQYRYIKRKIICEQLLVEQGQNMLDDYKIICSYGKAKAILVCADRNKGRDYYSLEWEYLNYVKDEYKSKKLHKKPKNLDEMISVAEKLSKPFPYARIDLYCVNGKIYFGEITLTPSGGNHKNLTEFGQKELGKMIEV